MHFEHPLFEAKSAEELAEQQRKEEAEKLLELKLQQAREILKDGNHENLRGPQTRMLPSPGIKGLLRPYLLGGYLRCNDELGGGFEYFWNFHPYLGEMIQFDEHIFQMGGENHQLVLKDGNHGNLRL